MRVSNTPTNQSEMTKKQDHELGRPLTVTKITRKLSDSGQSQHGLAGLWTVIKKRCRKVFKLNNPDTSNRTISGHNKDLDRTTYYSRKQACNENPKMVIQIFKDHILDLDRSGGPNSNFKALQAGSKSELSFDDAKKLQTLAKQNQYKTAMAPVYIKFVDYLRDRGHTQEIGAEQLVSTVSSLINRPNEIVVNHSDKPNFYEMKIIQALTSPKSLSVPDIMSLSQLLTLKQSESVTYKQLIDLVTDMKNMSNDERDEAIASMSDGIMVSHPNKPNFHEMKIIQGLTRPNSLSAPNIMILSQELASKNQNEVTVKQLTDEVKRVASLTEEQKNETLSELGRKHANHLAWLHFDKKSEDKVIGTLLTPIENMKGEIGRITKHNEAHITVAFFGHQPNENFIRNVGLDVNKTVTLRFSKAEIFNNHLVITNEKGAESEGLKDIHNALIKKASEAGIELSDTYNGKNYRPHITLVRDIPIERQAELLEQFNYLNHEPITLTGNIAVGYTSLYTVDDEQSHYHDINELDD
ncbi:2'-5' RNA ligase family protein [Vibrio aquimaris]|uniref:Uncharacterized protein n=2 Tax=Vibrio aquimaris TaxID=2587862 RepID=A0A5P9CKS1_9VIBR|nr:hypothetical protein FIV01_07635 [Vibrio aquimaris]